MTRTTQAQAIEALTAQVAALTTLVTAQAQAPAKVAKVASKGVTERRADGDGGTCDEHAKSFAYASGLAWHMENIKHG